MRYPLVAATTAAWLALLTSSPVFACLWDSDTLAMEQQRFPDTVEVISGSFLAHSQDYYRWRIEHCEAQLAAGESTPELYDDLAVAYDKVGQHDQAIETVLTKEEKFPGLYETYANWGTFLIHNDQYAEGVAKLKQAIEINPDAHFGREIYQVLLVEYLISKQVGDDTLLPLDEVRRGLEFRGGFAEFVLKNRPAAKDPQKELAAAQQGVLGMMRFGDFQNPVLLEALGDLLLAAPDDAKQLAARAYLAASYVVQDPVEEEAYRQMAEESLDTQQAIKPHQADSNLTLAEVERQLTGEIDSGRAWRRLIRRDERAWIEQGANVDLEFRRKYYSMGEALLPPAWWGVVALLSVVAICLMGWIVRGGPDRVPPPTTAAALAASLPWDDDWDDEDFGCMPDG